MRDLKHEIENFRVFMNIECGSWNDTEIISQ